jgi:hypothetical protein
MSERATACLFYVAWALLATCVALDYTPAGIAGVAVLWLLAFDAALRWYFAERP